MLRALVFAAIVAVAIGAAVPKHPKLEGRIVGGRPVDIKDYPYQVSLQYYGSHICGATLINSNTVVTAAHCTDGFSSLSIKYGSSQLDEGTEVKVKKVNQHPKYDRNNIDYDVSVLWLADYVDRTPADLPIISKDTLNEGDIVDISGWGTLVEGGGSLPKVLQLVQVPIVSNEVCDAAYGGGITDRMICAGLLGVGGKDACQGDSGGPLVKDNILWGIVSWGYGCAQPEYPGVYSSVENLIDFIILSS